MKYLNLLLLMGLSVFMFSCSDDDDPDPKDANPIYFETSSTLTLDVSGDFNDTPIESLKIDNLQLNFDHVANEIRIVTKLTPTVSGQGATIAVPFVYDVTFKNVNSTRSDDYKYTISIAEGTAYNESLSLAASCQADPDFGASTLDAAISVTDFIEWDSSQNKYYVSSASLLAFVFGAVDPGFTLPPGTDPSFANFPKIYQSTSSIKGCSELPTTLPN